MGDSFTWPNMQVEEANILSRLNRAVANNNWCVLFPHAKIIHEVMVGSDHRPLVLVWSQNHRKRKRSFRFEAKWLEEDSCVSTVEGAWAYTGRGSDMFCLVQKMANCKEELNRWSRENVGNSKVEIDRWTSTLKML